MRRETPKQRAKRLTLFKRLGLTIGKVVKLQGFKTVKASYDDKTEFVLDPAGYLLIRTHPSTKQIEIGWCSKPNQVTIAVIGKHPLEIYQTFLNKLPNKYITRMDHAAYLGRELERAYTALRLGVDYVQDAPLKIRPAKPKRIKAGRKSRRI
ncbi:MAG TPA: DUF4346 domain-containing protein [Candidatus Nanoarchaeia archaeon]|nr:DUF4346 domain-containing protein [Candidatus Nanoarchaeia archaeon]